ncbi:hypothetical protein [Acanthopleuribacter pedis]|uniref:DUF481 domain-containing protein n=1 Tax=Acanthopleuribacter pedis TaxID=442870 RepID=A0A8J7QNP0_9BACT|nr:hypothetical protein [Acanthopleuribacter pedis]MBO1321773.1 hypothetical protein [Acanthopleuribacter pedis]
MAHPVFRSFLLHCLFVPFFPLLAQSPTYTLDIEAWRGESALEYSAEAITAAASAASDTLHQPGVPEYRENLVALRAGLGMQNKLWFARFDIGQTPTYGERVQTVTETLATERDYEMQRQDLGLTLGFRWKTFGFFAGYQHTEFEEKIRELQYQLTVGTEVFDLALPGDSSSDWHYRGGLIGLNHHEKLENAPLIVYAALSGVWLQGDARYDTALTNTDDPTAPRRTQGPTARRDTELSGISAEVALHWQLNRRWTFKIGYRHQDWDERNNLVLPQVRNGDGTLGFAIHF